MEEKRGGGEGRVEGRKSGGEKEGCKEGVIAILNIAFNMHIQLQTIGRHSPVQPQ